MSSIFHLKTGDTSPALRFALEPIDVNLVGATARFLMRSAQGVALVAATAQIESTSPPILRYPWAEGDTDVPGSHLAEFEVTYADGSVETFPNSGFITVLVKPGLG